MYLVLGQAPLPIWPSGRVAARMHERFAEWTTSVSNRACAVCKTALHTCACPMRANGRTRTDSLRLTRAAHGPSVLRWQSRWQDSNLLPSAYKADARPVVLHRHACPRRESNPHRPGSRPGASPHWATWATWRFLAWTRTKLSTFRASRPTARRRGICAIIHCGLVNDDDSGRRADGDSDAQRKRRPDPVRVGGVSARARRYPDRVRRLTPVAANSPRGCCRRLVRYCDVITVKAPDWLGWCVRIPL